MKLSDVMSALELHVFAEIAFILVAAAFVTVLVTTFLRRNREPFARAVMIPLDDEPARAGARENRHD